MSRNVDYNEGGHGYWDTIETHKASTNEENQKYCNSPKSSPKDDGMRKCWYCNKMFQKGPIYDNHYSICYDNYAYMHM